MRSLLHNKSNSSERDSRRCEQKARRRSSIRSTGKFLSLSLSLTHDHMCSPSHAQDTHLVSDGHSSLAPIRISHNKYYSPLWQLNSCVGCFGVSVDAHTLAHRGYTHTRESIGHAAHSAREAGIVHTADAAGLAAARRRGSRARRRRESRSGLPGHPSRVSYVRAAPRGERLLPCEVHRNEEEEEEEVESIAGESACARAKIRRGEV